MEPKHRQLFFLRYEQAKKDITPGKNESPAKDCQELFKQIESMPGLNLQKPDPCSGDCPPNIHKMQVYTGEYGMHVQRQNGDGSWSDMEYNGHPPRRCEQKAPDGMSTCPMLCAPN